MALAKSATNPSIKLFYHTNILILICLLELNNLIVFGLKGREKGTGILEKPIAALTNIIEFYNKTLELEKTLSQHEKYKPEDLIDPELNTIESQLVLVSEQLTTLEEEEKIENDREKLKPGLNRLFETIYGDEMMEIYLAKAKLTEKKLESLNQTISTELNTILDQQKLLGDYIIDLEIAGVYLKSPDFLDEIPEIQEKYVAIIFDNSFLSTILFELENMHQLDDLYKRFLEGKVTAQGVKWEGKEYPFTKVVEILEEMEENFDNAVKEKDKMLRIFQQLVAFNIQKIVKKTIEIGDKYKNIGQQLKSMTDAFIEKHEKLERRFLKFNARLGSLDSHDEL